MSIKLLISGTDVVNINSYLGNINPMSITARSLEFTNTDPSGNKIIGNITYETNSIQTQSNIIFTDYSGYFPTLIPSSNEASIIDLFDNTLFYQVLDPILYINYQGINYTVNKVMNIGPNLIMLMNIVV